MYNSYTKGSDAYWAAEEAIGAIRELQSSANGVEEIFENLVGQIDGAEDEYKELESENKDLTEEVSDLKARLEEQDADKNEMIKLMTDLKLAAVGIDTFATNKLISLGALNENKAADDNSRDSRDGSIKDCTFKEGKPDPT